MDCCLQYGRILKIRLVSEASVAVEEIDSFGELECTIQWKSVVFQESWDSLYKNWYPLWRAYHHCVDHSRKRNARRRLSSFKQLELPGHAPFHFSKELRKALERDQPGIIKLIRLIDSPAYQFSGTANKMMQLQTSLNDEISGIELLSSAPQDSLK